MKAAFNVSGIRLAWADRCAVAVRQILQSNDALRAFTDGKIRRAVLMALPAGLTPNCILVCAGVPRLAEPGIGQCSKLALSVQIGVCWEQPMELLEDDEATAAAVFAEIIRAVLANPMLMVTSYGKRRLTDKVSDIRPLGPPMWQGGQGSVTLLDFIEIEFEKELDAQVWDIE